MHPKEWSFKLKKIEREASQSKLIRSSITTKAGGREAPAEKQERSSIEVLALCRGYCPYKEPHYLFGLGVGFIDCTIFTPSVSF